MLSILPMRVLFAAMVATAVVAGASAAASNTWAAPAFYKGLEGPRFTVIRTIEGNPPIQLRRYDAGSWVATAREVWMCLWWRGRASVQQPYTSTQSSPILWAAVTCTHTHVHTHAMVHMQAPDVDAAMGGRSGAFMALFRYISGTNAQQQKIEMTAPVLTKVVPGQGPTCNSSFTTMFYNPYKYQKPGSDAPSPREAGVSLVMLPRMDVYVLSFSGYASGPDYRSHAAKLINRLTAAGVAFNASGPWFVAGYDSPYTLTNRHNEVWIPAGGSGGTSSAPPAAVGR